MQPIFPDQHLKNRRHPLVCNAQVPVWHRIPGNVANCPNCLGLMALKHINTGHIRAPVKIINGYDINGSMGLEWKKCSGIGP